MCALYLCMPLLSFSFSFSFSPVQFLEIVLQRFVYSWHRYAQCRTVCTVASACHTHAIHLPIPLINTHSNAIPHSSIETVWIMVNHLPSLFCSRLVPDESFEEELRVAIRYTAAAFLRRAKKVPRQRRIPASLQFGVCQV